MTYTTDNSKRKSEVLIREVWFPNSRQLGAAVKG